MRTVLKPNKAEWKELLARPTVETETLEAAVKEILMSVKKEGDKALYAYTEKFDKAKLKSFSITPEEIENAHKVLPNALKSAIELAKNNIEKFHMSQMEGQKKIETIEGVQCWRKSIGIEKVGLYIPGGTAPLFSTILMLGIPAKIAGCKEVVLCTPPNEEGEIAPAILYTADLLGISQIFKVGGAQAIAAMTYGTASIPEVFKIFGPGNQFVTKAKELVRNEGIAIDMPAGPSEVLVIADNYSNASYIAADLLSQAEHGEDSQVMLVSNDLSVIQRVESEVNSQLKSLPRRQTAEKSLQNSASILLDTLDDCIAFSNAYAPEHLILAVRNRSSLVNKIKNAGSVFLGDYSCESAGDYASGTNHTLPTNGYARNYSGVSVDSFVKKITFQELTPQGLLNIGSAIETMAEAEGLYAHKNAVSIRLKDLKK